MSWFLEGGVGMYVVLGAGVLVGLGGGLSALVSIVAWFFRPLRVLARIGGILAVFACILPMIIGVGASAYARSQVRQALEFADPDQREIIAAIGAHEASIPTTFGAAMSCLVLMPAVLGVMIALPIPAPKTDEDED